MVGSLVLVVRIWRELPHCDDGRTLLNRAGYRGGYGSGRQTRREFSEHVRSVEKSHGRAGARLSVVFPVEDLRLWRALRGTVGDGTCCTECRRD